MLNDVICGGGRNTLYMLQEVWIGKEDVSNSKSDYLTLNSFSSSLFYELSTIKLHYF